MKKQIEMVLWKCPYCGNWTPIRGDGGFSFNGAECIFCKREFYSL